MAVSRHACLAGVSEWRSGLSPPQPGLACPTGSVNTDDKQGLSISELFLLPDQLRDGLLRAILLEGIPVSLIGENAVRHWGATIRRAPPFRVRVNQLLPGGHLPYQSGASA